MKKRFRIVLPALLALALAHFSVGAAKTDRLAEAKGLYMQAVPMAADSPERVELLKQAEVILTGVIADDPGSLEAHRKLMGVYLLQQDYTKAIRTLQDAISLSPEDPKLFIALAFLYEHSGAYDLSEATLAHALELDPGNEMAKEYLAVMRKKIAEQEERRQQGSMAHGGQSGRDPHAGIAHPGKGVEAASEPGAARP